MTTNQTKKLEHFHLEYFHGATLVGEKKMPLLKGTEDVPHHVISYTEIKQTSDKANYFVDFFVDDYRFKDLWYLKDFETILQLYLLNNTPNIHKVSDIYKFSTEYELDMLYAKLNYIVRQLKDFAGVIGMDFSMYPEMHPIQRIWNCLRSRMMAYYFQQHGFSVIPTASWACKEDFEYCFDGIPKHSSVAISSNGCKKNEYSKSMFLKGVRELQNRLEPSTLIVCGSMPELKKYKNVFFYPSFSERKNIRKRNTQEKRDMQLNLIY